MRAFFVDVNIPASPETFDRAMLVSSAVEDQIGSCDTGLGFGWRDMQIECADEADQRRVARIVRETLTAYGFSYTEGYENREERTAQVSASIITRDADPDEEEHDGELYPSIPPGVEE